MAKITRNAQQDERNKMYRTAVGLQIKEGLLKTFADIFAGKRFPKQYIVEDLGMSHGRITSLISNPDDLSLGDCKRFGEYFDVPAATIALLGFNQTPKTKPR